MAAPTTDRPVRQRADRRRGVPRSPSAIRPARDRFDSIPEELYRVGAHRAKAHWTRGLINLAWAVGAILVLSVAGLWGLSQINDDFQFGLPFIESAEEQPQQPPADDAPEAADPVIDPDLPITVLNGTPTSGLSNTVGDYLVSQGWNGAEFGVGARVNASSSDVETTQVIYNDPANEGAARGMLETLGVGELVLANTYPASPLAVLVGSDFALPAG